ncbi:hypothetical protein FMO13_03510 [Xanthomonas phaseoli pv. dieffenbachiae]
MSCARHRRRRCRQPTSAALRLGAAIRRLRSAYLKQMPWTPAQQRAAEAHTRQAPHGDCLVATIMKRRTQRCPRVRTVVARACLHVALSGIG